MSEILMSEPSLQLIDAVFEDDLTSFVDHAVTNARKCEDSSNDGAHIDQELEKVLSLISVQHSEWRHFIVENNQALERLKLSLA